MLLSAVVFPLSGVPQFETLVPLSGSQIPPKAPVSPLNPPFPQRGNILLPFPSDLISFSLLPNQVVSQVWFCTMVHSELRPKTRPCKQHAKKI